MGIAKAAHYVQKSLRLFRTHTLKNRYGGKPPNKNKRIIETTPKNSNHIAIEPQTQRKKNNHKYFRKLQTVSLPNVKLTEKKKFPPSDKSDKKTSIQKVKGETEDHQLKF